MARPVFVVRRRLNTGPPSRQWPRTDLHQLMQDRVPPMPVAKCDGTARVVCSQNLGIRISKGSRGRVVPEVVHRIVDTEALAKSLQELRLLSIETLVIKKTPYSRILPLAKSRFACTSRPRRECPNTGCCTASTIPKSAPEYLDSTYFECS